MVKLLLVFGFITAVIAVVGLLKAADDGNVPA